MATEIWRSFEKRIIDDLTVQRVAITQIPSHLQQGKARVFRKKTDCDFAAGPDGRAVFFDAKVCGERLFNLRSLILRPKKIHQYRFLVSCVEKACVGGYLIWFYKHGHVSWLPAENIHRLVANEDRSVQFDSPEVRSQRDDEPINLTRLIWGP